MTPIQTTKIVLRVQVDQSVFHIPIDENSVINCSVVQKCCKTRAMTDLPPKFQVLQKQYESELEQLKTLGFDNIRKNLIVLSRTQGDVNEAAVRLQKFQKTSESKKQELAQRYSNEVQILAAKGFSNTNLVLRLLNKFDGNVDQVEQILLKKSHRIQGRRACKFGKRECHSKPTLDINQYSNEVEIIAAKGFSNTNLVLRLLNKFDGNVDLVEKILSKKHALRQQGCAKIDINQYSNEVEILAAKGFSNTNIVLRLLNKFDGNVEQVEEILLKKRALRQQGCAKIEERRQKLNQRYATQVEILAAKGFPNTNLVLRLLNKFDGNVDKVEEILVKKSQHKQDGKRGCHKMKEFLEQYSDQLSQMEQRGLVNKRMNFIALRRSDGDVEKAVQLLEQTKNPNMIRKRK